MFRRLYDILYEYREYAILSGFIVLSFILMALNDNPQVKRIRAISTVTFGVVQEQLSFIPTYLSLKSENEFLRRINIELADEVQRLREAKLENLMLHQLLNLKDQLPFKLTTARVVNKNLIMLRNTITLDVGTEEGIQQYMPVVSEGGLVGIIISLTPHYSVANILLNTDFRVSGKIQRSRVDGIVAWNGKTLTLKNIPKTRDVRTGDVVTTSEYSQAFPPNIRVGIVNDVHDQPSSLFKSITITPGVDFIKLEEVFVVLFTPEKERSELEQRTDQRIGK